MKMAPEGWPFVLPLLASGIVARFTGYPRLGNTLLGAGAATAAFFRDPERVVPIDPNHLVSPADGTIVSISEVEEPDFIKGPATRISIFLSIFDVHLNRSPIGGRVAYRRYVPGTFLDARDSNASESNERSLIGIDSALGPILVTQVAGKIARRIVTDVTIGDTIEQGRRIGLIRFGSRTDLHVPVQPAGAPFRLEPRVDLRDKVVGGESVIMEVRA